MKKNYSKKITVLGCALFTSILSFAQAPANDDCSGAIGISVAANAGACVATTANTTNATAETYTSACWFSSYDDGVWYSFTASNDSLTLSFSNISVGGGQIGYALFATNCPPTSSEFNCGGPVAASNNLITGFTIGQTYFLSVFYSGTANRGTFDLCLYEPAPPPAPPANDNCSGAISISVAANRGVCASTSVNTTSATIESYTSGCWATSYDDGVWYSFTASNDSLVILTTNNSLGSVGMGYALFAANCPPTSTELSCNGFTDSIKVVGLTPSQLYYLSIFYSGTTNRGTFDLCIYDNQTVGINELSSGTTFTIYPNPNNGNFDLKLNGVIDNSNIDIVDIQGRTILHQENINSNKSFDISSFANGIYYLKLTNEKGISVKKFVKQN